MTIKCEYCGNMMDDTLDRCPDCGAQNRHVRRSTVDQPTTIEELKQWYSDRGLPPAAVTRFFIGINYTKPKAFGIYLDESTGNYIVYKNKASGERAIRYQGTDEAYAVNELLQRLKQEILEQKQRSSGTEKKQEKAKKKLHPALQFLLNLVLWIGGTVGGGFLVIMLIGTIVVMVEPKVGYYEYLGNTYYHAIATTDDTSWYVFSQSEWSDPIPFANLPEVFEKRKTCKPYFIRENWDASLHCSDFNDSIASKDLALGDFADQGYYTFGEDVYYHLENRYRDGWYSCQTRWRPVAFTALPKALQHRSLLADYYRGTDYSRSLSVPDFADTLYYRDYYAPGTAEKGYYQVQNHIFYHLANDYDEGWYTYLDDGWETTDELPEELSHPSTISDYYFTPDWDAQTQYTDFTDTALYKSDKDNWSNSSSSYDWSSNDSWDSGSSDWDSDW